MDSKDFQREWKDPQSNLQRLLAPLQAGNIDVSHICLIHLVGWFLTDEVLSNSRARQTTGVRWSHQAILSHLVFIHDSCTEKLHKLKVQWLPHKSSLATEKPMGPSRPPETNTFLFYRQVAALGGGQGGGIVTAAKECDTTVSAVPVSLPRSRFWQKDCGDTLKWSQKPWEAWGIPENGQPVPGNEYEQTIFETISQEQFAICAYSLNSFHSSNNRGQYYNFCSDTT